MKSASQKSLLAILAAACAGVTGSAAFAQQVTDAALISNKDWDSGGNTGYVVTMDDKEDGEILTGQWKVNYRADGSDRIDTPDSWQVYNRGVWNHVVTTYERFSVDVGNGVFQTQTRIETYLNGVKVTAGNNISGPGNVDTYSLGLNLNIGNDGTGNYQNTGNSGFLGRVDDVAIWRRAITASEVSSIYGLGNSSSLSLSQVVGSNASIGNSLVGLYGFDGNATDTASTVAGNTSTATKNGDWRNSASGDSISGSYTAGKFGQAANFDTTNYVTIGDANSFAADYIFGSQVSFTFSMWFFEAIPSTVINTFTGSGGANATASGNWTAVAPANWDETTALFVGGNSPQSNTVVFDSSVGPRSIAYVQFGAAGETSNITLEPGVHLIGKANAGAIIGTPDSTVNLVLNSAELNHWGQAEEAQRMTIGQTGAHVNITLNGNSLLGAGTLIADPTFATGYRRPNLDGSDGIPRRGDDILLGDGANGSVTLTMNDSSRLFVADVFYVGDSASSAPVNVTQNGDSLVVANWDTRWLDDGAATGKVVNWTMNGNSKFLVARDHALSESGSGGVVNLTINDNAEFAAGDRIYLGGGGSNQVNVTLNGGTIRVGRASAGADLLVDDTRAPAGTVGDFMLVLGSQADARLTVNSGLVSVGRNAYVGFSGGTGVVDLNGGQFNILGIGTFGRTRLGNFPDGNAIPFPYLGAASTTSPWLDQGGDLFISFGGHPSRGAPVGAMNVSGTGSLNVFRDVQVGGTYYDAAFTGGGAPGVSSATLSVRGNQASVNIGGNLVFGGVSFNNTTDYIVGGDTNAVLSAKITGPSHSPIKVNGTAPGRGGDVVIFNSTSEKVTSTVDVTIDVPYATYRPATGATFNLVQYAGTRLQGPNGDGIVPLGTQGAFASVTGNSVDGIDWTIQYDDANKKIGVVATKVYKLGNTDRDAADTVTVNDFNQLVAGYGSTGDKIFADGDFNNDGNVTLADFSIQRAAATPATPTGLTGNARLVVNVLTGATQVKASSTVLAGIEITSASGALDSTAFPTAGAFSDIFSSPAAVLASTDTGVAVASFEGSASLGTINLDNLFKVGSMHDLVFSYTDLTGGPADLRFGQVAYLMPGDTNFDALVNFDDLTALLGNYNLSGLSGDIETLYGFGDFDLNGTVDFDDLTVLLGNYNAVPSSPFALGTAAVPEPGALGLLCVAGLALGRRRR